MRVLLPVLTALALGLGACSDPPADLLAPVRRPAFDVNSSTDVHLTFTYTGPSSAQYGSVPTVSAQATLNGAPVAGVQFSFVIHEVGTPSNFFDQCRSGATDANGTASCALQSAAFQNIGSYQLDVLTGTTGYAGGILNLPFTITPALTTTTYTGPTTFISNQTSVTLSASVTWADGLYLGQPTGSVNFDLSWPDGNEYSCSAVISYSGIAQCTIPVVLEQGSLTIRVSYPGSHLFSPSGATVAGVVNPALPTTKGQCLDGGWQSYQVFKNQGDCVSWIATNGKNSPTY